MSKALDRLEKSAERLPKIGTKLAERRIQKEQTTWPEYHHSPEDPDRARLYYFNKAGEVIPRPEIAEKIADSYLSSLFVPKVSWITKPEHPKLSVVYTGEQPGSKLLIDTAMKLAVEKYGVLPEDILYIDRTPKAEAQRLSTLQTLREEGKLDERQQYLNKIEAQEMEAVDRVRDNAGGHLAVTETNPEALEMFNTEDRADLTNARQKARKVRGRHEVVWMLSSYPHPNTAKVDQQINPDMDVNQEQEVYEWLKACERPRADILKAHEVLRQTLNKTYRLRVITHPEDGNYATDVTFGTTRVDENGNEVPRRFNNHAGYQHNFPGSEMFGAPSLESGVGKIAYPYPVMFEGTLLPNLKLNVVNGRIESWEIIGDEDAAKRFADKMNEKGYPENRYFGEFGIGTSPYPTFNTIDIGFNEKRTGVHLTPGAAYTTIVDESGEISDLDNGNTKANMHADFVIPASKATGLQVWAEVGQPQDDGTFKKEWKLFIANGAFITQLEDGRYQADQRLAILHSLDADQQPFNAELPQDKTRRTEAA